MKRIRTYSNDTRYIGWQVLVIAFLIAFIVRVINLSTIPIQHYDESIYLLRAGEGLASSWAEILKQNILDIYFAPPLFYGLIMLAYQCIGPAPEAAILVSIVAGALAVPILMLLGAELFDRRAGLIAGGLLCFTEYHLLYSRMALTDALFTTLFLASFRLLLEHDRTANRGALAGGVVCAIAACWTKYSGILIVPLYLLSILATQWFAPWVDLSSPHRHLKTRLFYAVLVAALVAFGCVPIAWLIHINPGWSAFLYFRTLHSSLLYPLDSLRELVLEYGSCLLLWIAPAVLFLIVSGFFRLSRAPRRGSVILLTLLIGYALSTLSYHKYPRLFLPAVPLLLVVAGWMASHLWGIFAAQPHLRRAIAGVLVLSLIGPLFRALQNPDPPFVRMIEQISFIRVHYPLPVYSAEPGPLLFYAATYPDSSIGIQYKEYDEILAMSVSGKRFFFVMDRLKKPVAKQMRIKKIAAIPGTFNEVELANRYSAARVLRVRLAGNLASSWFPIELYFVNPPPD
ncbi:MAG: phospholipid carrier-dependent glycosyltransferase [Planctomycetota bacterium]